ncbi:hypothetical protein ACFXPR_09035 [Nocardia tengchongensis]|uniref:beta family protein n=1 Tax=Nocardia tengchongensis TaxID=2055889 RepID=UPI0036C8AC4F
MKNRSGELTALEHMANDLAGSCLPLVEIGTTRGMCGADGPSCTTTLKRELTISLDTLRKHWNVRFDLMVDAHGLPGANDWNATAHAVKDCFDSALLGVIPVVRLSDPEAVLREVGSAVRRAIYQPICIRLTAADLHADAVSRLGKRLDQALHALETTTRGIHLVLDLGGISSETEAVGKTRLVERLLLDLPHPEEWLSITVAGGAFPPDLRGIQAKTLARIERREAGLWRRVRQQLRERTRVPAFGDYGVAYPTPNRGRGFRASPQLRYTIDHSWLVVRYRRDEQYSRFFDICGEIADHPEFTRGLTWGDDEIAARAEQLRADRGAAHAGPGNGSTWRAIGTSHHIGFVIDRLRTEDQP